MTVFHINGNGNGNGTPAKVPLNRSEEVKEVSLGNSSEFTCIRCRSIVTLLPTDMAT